MHCIDDVLEFKSKNGTIPTLLKTGDGHLAKLLTTNRQVVERQLSGGSAAQGYATFFDQLGDDMKKISAHMIGPDADYRKAAIIVDKNFTPKSFGGNGQLKEPGGWHAWINLRTLVPSSVRVVVVGLYANGMLGALGTHCKTISDDWPFPFSPSMVVLTVYRMTRRTGHILHDISGMGLAEKVLKGLRSYKLFEIEDFIASISAEKLAEHSQSELSKHVLEHTNVAGKETFDLAVDWPILKEGADELLSPQHISILRNALNLVPNHVQLDKKREPELWDERCKQVWELLQPVVEEMGPKIPVHSIEDSALTLVRAIQEGCGVHC
jgi:hypothetical protein